jgi:wyosine [tRNA(Phe)-imidazoG37] synthetase (radical SAM superfamily)
MAEVLIPEDHNRNVYDMRYIYPVVSRRAGGVSIGVNLNVNSACNWRCIYCQVPNLSRGGPQPIDLVLLEKELSTMLRDATSGTFMANYVDEKNRKLQDIAFSGNGEPTSAPEFLDALHIVKKLLGQYDLLGNIKVRLITNGSQMDKLHVREAVKFLASINGEVWFKLDGGREEDIYRINDVRIKVASHLRRLRACATLCPTYVQTCMFGLQGSAPDAAQVNAYIDAVSSVKDSIKGVHLYGYARPSYQPEAVTLTRLPVEALERVAAPLRAQGVEVNVSY